MANLKPDLPFANVNKGDKNSDNDDFGDLYGTPTCTSIARKLELSTLKSAGSETIDSVQNNSFFKHCYSLMCSILSEEDNDICDTLTNIFIQHRIRLESGLGLIPFKSLPTPSVHFLWGVTTFHEAFKLLILVCRTSLIITDKTTFIDICTAAATVKVDSTGDNGDDDETNSVLSSASVANTGKQFSLKAIQAIDLREYSGETDKYISWIESTCRCFGRAAARQLLTDVQLCNDNIEVSYAVKCIVETSLESGSASHLNTTYKNEHNLAIFMKIIDINNTIKLWMLKTREGSLLEYCKTPKTT